MNPQQTGTWLRIAGAALAIPALLLVFTAETVFCQSPGQTVEKKYPGLVSGVLKYARLASMDEQMLFQSEKVTINQAGLTRQLNAMDDATRSQLEKNLLFFLDQEATRAILENEAEKDGFASRDLSDGENLQAFLEHKAETIKVTEIEARKFYQENKDIVNQAPFQQVRDAIHDYLIQRKKQQFISDYIDEVAAKTDMQVNKQWVQKQSRIAMDNPVDKARNSGLPTMVEFGADGCGPCDRMQPILDQMRKDYPDSLNVVFVHVGEDQMLAARFGVRSIPVQVFYDADGKEVFRHTGFLPKEKVYSQLASMGVGPQPAEAFAIGGGPVEILLFTDYFCPPCKDIEPYLENTLPELVSSGAKVTFVDAPFSRKSALYSRYFLYAAKAASSPESIIHARSVLFDLAEKDKIESEPDMVKALKKNSVDIELVDTQPLIDQWKKLMETHDLRSTPTCVIIRPGREPEQYRGGKAIPEALGRLLDEMSSK
ncbi:MAG: thioredoxin family protein [Desulfobacteraceae bacterium]|nr:thioredoxin family protein [Desulfobacteraceae bacterium]